MYGIPLACVAFLIATGCTKSNFGYDGLRLRDPDDRTLVS
jgi:hypothetical protein